MLSPFSGAEMGWGTGSQGGRWRRLEWGTGGFAHLSFSHFFCPDGFHQHGDGAGWASDVGSSCVDGHRTAFLAEEDFSPYGHSGAEDDPEYPMGTTAQLPGLQAPRGECATSLARECQPGRACAGEYGLSRGTRNTPFKFLERKR